ncbi:NAD(P)-dependent oxidoreductase [Acerihabitans sp. KWT182]|uniref:NAD(P)-dependent oxidoreductase n=1 Tax=Acerihabitans sp. KWT182 TaxID=3157919 RepID=A0AAU7QFF4_9GAMM
MYHNVNRFSKEKERELGITYKSFEDVISLSDILTLHLPLLPSTRNIIGVKELKAMKNTAILVDTARDSLVDLKALVDALKNGEISGAAIDILDPIAADSPFKDIDDLNLVLTPHIGAATYDNYDRVYKLCGTNALHILHGEKPEMVLKLG